MSRTVQPRTIRWHALLCGFLLPTFCLAEEKVQKVEEDPITASDRQHWSFRPLQRVEAPVVKHPELVRNKIDCFILRDLEARGLSLMPQADPAALIRRVAFDLTGLPPTRESVLEFVQDPSDARYEAYVDQLLQSAAYGERWAQHWLDLVRFAETDGFEHDQTRADAWRYRDWVIQALNRDIPYDEFVKLQIAGDEYKPGDDWATLATGFLLAGPDMPDINSQEERRHVVLSDITSTIGSALMGLTMNCAQCHDHPYDPVSQADFYRLQAFFSNSIYPKGGQQLGYVIQEPGKQPPRTFVMMRGDFRDAGPEVAPWFLRIVNPKHEQVPSLLETMRPKSSGRRAAFAEWLTRKDNQLFLRVIANRLWLYHFDRPLVGTPNDFGRKGELPTHPDLLDWLATELPRQQWSLKQMHKLLVTSATYRQTSRPVNDQWKAATQADPENRYYSRMHRRRLSGEEIRDAMLVVSEQLNEKRGGPGVMLPLPEEVKVTLLKKHLKVTEDPKEYTRRSVYVFARRNLRYPMFDVFDRPDGLMSCAQRTVSTTATQSLTQMNSPFTRETANHVAESIVEVTGDASSWVDLATWRILGRAPTNLEFQLSKMWLHNQVDLTRDAPDALSDYCVALLNSNAFLYVD